MSTNQTHDEFAGQVGIVTGASRGIGRAIAITLAGAGMRVAVAARSTGKLAETVAIIEANGGCAMAYTLDVTDQGAIEAMVAGVIRDLGQVDLLVNNAGVGGPAGPMWQTNPDDWWQCMAVNLRGVYLTSHAVLPGMVARQKGRIINLASGVGLGAFQYGSAYGVSKCAVIRLSETMALELQEYGICVFSIHPGFVNTYMVQEKIRDQDDDKWLGSWFQNALADNLDILPECPAELVKILASGQADALNGCFLSVDDDVHEMIQQIQETGDSQLFRLRLQT